MKYLAGFAVAMTVAAVVSTSFGIVQYQRAERLAEARATASHWRGYWGNAAQMMGLAVFCKADESVSLLPVWNDECVDGEWMGDGWAYYGVKPEERLKRLLFVREQWSKASGTTTN